MHNISRIVNICLAAWLLTLSGGVAAVEQVEYEQLARRGGAYLSAIIAFQVFKESACGPRTEFKDAWLNLKKARTEVDAGFPAKYRKELTQIDGLLNSSRIRFRQMFADPRLSTKCPEVRGLLERGFETAESEWRAKRDQLKR